MQTQKSPSSSVLKNEAVVGPTPFSQFNFDTEDLKGYNISRKTLVGGPQQSSRIISLPRHLRLEIWKRVHYKHFGELRLTCRQIVDDIDNHLGISTRVDGREQEFLEHFAGIGIRHATVLNLAFPRVSAHLAYPELLVELTIKGFCSPAFFSYFLYSCKNIVSLSLNFSKQILENKPTFFPQSFGCLYSLKTLKCTAHTKKEKDLIYVCNNLSFLFKETLEHQHSLVELHFTLSFKGASPYLDEIVMALFMFLHKNYKTLNELVILTREKPFAEPDDDESTDPNVDGPKPFVRRGTEFVPKKKSIRGPINIPTPNTEGTTSTQLIQFRADSRNSETLDAAERYLSGKKWPWFPALKTAVVVVNSDMFRYAEDFLPKASNLKHLKLEISAGEVENCWYSFHNIVTDVAVNLTSIKLANVSYENEEKVPLDIDFELFRPCHSLKQLHISLLKRESAHLPAALNITSLPRSLVELEIMYLTLSPWQWFRLLRFKHLHYLTLSYVTKSDSTFGCFIKIMKWLIRLKLTQVQVFLLTDFKIRFRNKRSALKKLRSKVPVQIDYRDKEETLLIVDRGNERMSEESIPSIDSDS